MLAPDGLGVVSFGADMDEAVAAVTAALGAEPSDDTGWIDPFAEFGTCPGTEVRGVSWGDLRLIFGDADTRLVPLGERHFYGFTYRTGRRGPDGLTTAEGIGLGSSRAELEAAYGEELELFLDDTITGGPRYQIGFEIDSSTYLSGILSSEDGVVVWLDGGVGCAPIA